MRHGYIGRRGKGCHELKRYLDDDRDGACWRRLERHLRSTPKRRNVSATPPRSPSPCWNGSSPPAPTPATWCSTRSAAAAPRSMRREARAAWIGIDVTHLAIGLIEKRLRDAFPGVAFQPTACRRTSPGPATWPRAAGGQELLFRVREMGAVADRRPARQPVEEGRGSWHRRQRLVRQDQPRHRVGQGRRQRQRRDDPRPARRHRAREGGHRHLPHPHAPDPGRC